MNSVSLIGHLTKDPKLVETAGKPVCELRIAVDNGRFQTTFIDVRSFGEQAYTCAEYLRKGRRVGVLGTLAFSEWRDADGQKRNRYSVIGRVDFLDRPRGGQAPEPEGPSPEAVAPDELEPLPELERPGELVAA
jgi:single-strand DNA-binding protein